MADARGAAKHPPCVGWPPPPQQLPRPNWVPRLRILARGHGGEGWPRGWPWRREVSGPENTSHPWDPSLPAGRHQGAGSRGALGWDETTSCWGGHQGTVGRGRGSQGGRGPRGAEPRRHRTHKTCFPHGCLIVWAAASATLTGVFSSTLTSSLVTLTAGLRAAGRPHRPPSPCPTRLGDGQAAIRPSLQVRSPAGLELHVASFLQHLGILPSTGSPFRLAQPFAV